MSGLSEVVFENVVSSQGHMINVRFFSVVRSVCLFILKSLRHAAFWSRLCLCSGSSHFENVVSS